MSSPRASLLVALGRLTVLAVGALAAPFASTSQPPPPDPQPPLIAPDLALRATLEQLHAEAAEFRRTGTLPRVVADFATTFPYPLRSSDLIEQLCRVQDDEDAVVDAYVRWQLLGFKPDLAAMTGEEFKTFAMRLPALQPNPACDARLHAAFEALAAKSGRNADAAAELERRWEETRFKMREAELLNQPAFLFREAVIAAMPATGPRRPGLMLRDLEDRIAAGCETRAAKSAITRELKARMLDDTISIEQRWELLKHVEALEKTGPSTRGIRDVVFYTDAPALVQYSNFEVTGSDAAKWTAYLNRHEP